MTGISEILVLILLITGILILPRMFKPAPAREKTKPVQAFSMKMRAGIVLSVIFPLAASILLKPWEDNLMLFLGIAVFPIILAWAVVWILAANKK